MAKLTDLIKGALNKKQEEHAPKAKGSTEKTVKAKSVAGAKPIKKAAGRGR